MAQVLRQAYLSKKSLRRLADDHNHVTFGGQRQSERTRFVASILITAFVRYRRAG